MRSVPSSYAFALMILLVYSSSCTQLREPLTDAQSKTATLLIEEELRNKPKWLFPATACPTEVMPTTGMKPKYQLEGCKDNPSECLRNCKASDPTACQALALLIQNHTEDFNEISEALFLRSCKLGI